MFFCCQVPLQKRFPSSLIRELENVVSDNFAVLSPNWKENRDKFKKIQTILFKVMNEIAKFFDFPELDLTPFAYTGITLKIVNLDMNVKPLIQKAFKIRDMFSKAIF